MGGNGRIRSLTRIVTRSVMVEPQVLLLHEENTVRLSPFLQHRGAGDSIMHVGQAKVLPSVQHHAAPWLGLISGPPLQMACPSSWGIGAPTRPVRPELGTRQTSVPGAGSSPMTPLRLGRRHRAHRPLLASHLDGGSACSSRTTTTLSVVGVNGLVQMRGILLTIDSKSPSEVIKTKSSTFSRSSVWLPVSAGVAVRRGGRLRCCRGPAGRGSHPHRRRTEPVEPARPAGAEVRTSAAAAVASCRGGRAPAGARLLGCRVPDAASERWGAVPAGCPLPLCERGHSRAAGRDGAPRIPERGQAGRGEAPPPPRIFRDLRRQLLPWTLHFGGWRVVAVGDTGLGREALPGARRSVLTLSLPFLLLVSLSRLVAGADVEAHLRRGHLRVRRGKGMVRV